MSIRGFSPFSLPYSSVLSVQSVVKNLCAFLSQLPPFAPVKIRVTPLLHLSTTQSLPSLTTFQGGAGDRCSNARGQECLRRSSAASGTIEPGRRRTPCWRRRNDATGLRSPRVREVVCATG